ncbi:MAG: hypothetical protein N3B21_09945 [Clostridia bacterium]|nr:hypothetical protein [Clostridia bacterium]
MISKKTCGILLKNSYYNYFTVGEIMNETVLKTFVDKFNKDKKEFYRKFEEITKKLEKIDSTFVRVDEKLEQVNRRIDKVEDMQTLIFGKLGSGRDKLDNVKIYLSRIETKLNEYSTLNLQGYKTIGGDLYSLKINLQRVRPIINWENNCDLTQAYNDIERKFIEIEEQLTYLNEENA